MLVGMIRILLAMLVLSAATVSAAQQSPVPGIRQAAIEFLESLTPGLREQAVFALDHPERKKWSNLPASMFRREGVSLGEMTPAQAVLAHRLLRSTLSSQGYLKTTGIIYLDEVLKNLASSRRPGRDFSSMFGQDLYWIGIFGYPGKNEAWGWQLDGHHLALNVTIVGDSISVTPTFMGSDPAEVRAGNFSGWMVQQGEDEAGIRLYQSLDTAQRKRALIAAESPEDVITGPTRGDRLQKPVGLPVSELGAGQRILFGELLDEYLGNYQPAISAAILGRIERGGELHFGWAGIGEDKPYYYRIHGPAVLIEFNNNYPPGSSRGPINHIHTVFREPGKDYGEDLLRQHLQESPHHQGS